MFNIIINLDRFYNKLLKIIWYSTWLWIHLQIKCKKCGKTYKEMFDTIVRCDYLEPGKGKPYEWHLCMICRKELINWFENNEY